MNTIERMFDTLKDLLVCHKYSPLRPLDWFFRRFG